MIEQPTPSTDEIDADCTSVLRKDLSETRRALEEERRLRFELEHRTSNAFFSILGLLNQAEASGEASVAQLGSIRDSVRSAVAAHSICTTRIGKTITVHEIVSQLLPTARLELTCPGITLSAGCGAKLAMVLAELATNSRKYGAMSVETGSVMLTFEQDPTSQQVACTWLERGGPPVTEVPSPGIGSVLVHEIVARDLSGTLEFGFDQDGACHRLTFPNQQSPQEAFSMRDNATSTTHPAAQPTG